MVSDNVFYAIFLLNLEIKFLKKEDPKNGLGILLKHKVPKRRVITEDDEF